MLVDFEKLSDKQREDFCEGFCDADDIGLTDWDSADPWGCPWFYASPTNLKGKNAYEWGRNWFLKNRAEIKALTDAEILRTI